MTHLMLQGTYPKLIDVKILQKSSKRYAGGHQFLSLKKML